MKRKHHSSYFYTVHWCSCGRDAGIVRLKSWLAGWPEQCSVSQKCIIVSLQIKSLEFNYFICSVPPPWIANSGLLGLLQLPKSELRGHSRLNFWLETRIFGLPTYSGTHHYLWMFFWFLAKILCALLKNVKFFYIVFLFLFLCPHTKSFCSALLSGEE